MRRLISLTLLLSVLIFPASQQPQVSAQTPTNQEVEAVFAQMDAEARVGQLFVVTFYGSDVSPDSEIASLIRDHHVGGVILTGSADNFTQDTDLAVQMYELAAALQTVNAGGPRDDPAGTPDAPPDDPTATPGALPTLPGYVPLFVGLEYGGDGWPYLLPNGDLSPLPTSMAIGASWNRANATAVGRIVGAELSATGVNLLLGPSVDVLETPQPLATGDLGTRVFGGEPYWVSEMAAAYLGGLHEGSRGRLAVTPGRFPGYGGADRPSTVEIPTVRRSRDQLTQSDLRPFIAVTGPASDPMVTADGLFVGHIRYQGFQADNLRVATPPVSLGAGALQSLLATQPFAAWRQNGGIVISDSLGVRGVRRFYDPAEIVFPARRIASDAFSAGSDMLYLGEFGTDPQANQADTVSDTIEYFVQRYRDDVAFREQVDASVRRILRTKLRLYGGTFDPSTVVPTRQGLQTLGQGGDVTLDVARGALTMLFPDQPDQATVPQRGDQIVIFTDTRTSQRCATCEARPIVSETALRDAILHAYGPTATGLVSPADVTSFSFDEMDAFLRFGPLTVQSGDETPEPDLLPIALNAADWVVFLMQDLDPTIPSSDVVKRFLAQPPVDADARLAVMAMGAPYYLDSTEVSKLTVFYGLYGYTDPFIEVAARALFQDFSPTGAAPVSVTALNYDIFRGTAADPNQAISLFYTIEGVGEGTATPEAGRAQLGDTLLLATDVIEDWNGNPVPDGTPVEFIQSYANETPRITQTVTLGGTAEATLVLDRQGELRVSVVSGEANNSETLRLVVSESGSAEIDVLPPEIPPTAAPTPTETPAPEETPETPPTATAEPAEVEETEVTASVRFADLFLALLGLLAMSALVFVLGFTRRDLNYGLLFALPTMIGGLIGYNYYALVLPGSAGWRGAFGGWSAGMASWLGALIGLGLVALAVRLWNQWVVPTLRNRNHR